MLPSHLQLSRIPSQTRDIYCEDLLFWAVYKIYPFNRLKSEDPLKGENIMEFQEVIRARRSCRSFDPSAVAQEQLSAILDAGQWAPSPLNLQPWEFIVITDPEKKMRIREAGEEARQSVVDSDGPGWVNKYRLCSIRPKAVWANISISPTVRCRPPRPVYRT
jgi:hypothetical protein